MIGKVLEAVIEGDEHWAANERVTVGDEPFQLLGHDRVKAIGAQPCHLAVECGGREPITGERGRTIIGDAVIHEDRDTLAPLAARNVAAQGPRPAPDDISRDPDFEGRADWRHDRSSVPSPPRPVTGGGSDRCDRDRSGSIAPARGLRSTASVSEIVLRTE